MPTATKSRASGCPKSRYRLQRIPAGTTTAPYPEGELCDRDGTYVPFAAKRADREPKGDPRLSLEERYGDHAAYVKRFEQAANQLVTERLLLREDAERLIARAKSAETVQRFTR